MISFQELTSTFLSPEGDALNMDAPESWAQGRTLYGGLSAALCHLAAQAHTSTTKPMKSALVCFVGPSSGHLSGRAETLRQGRSTEVIEATLMAEKGVGTRAVFVYGDDRESRIRQSSLMMPQVDAPEDCPDFFGSRRPAFAEHFDCRKAGGYQPVTSAPEGEMLVWCRHNTPVGEDQLAALLALADVLPPAVFTMFAEPAPISTITWSVEILQSEPVVDNNWFLFQSLADHTENGYSSQAMYLWDREGRPVLAARQNVTVFY